MTKDQLFKDVVRQFFQAFVELFFPDVAAHLDFSRVTFPNKETFTDFPDGARREADLLAEVYTKEGDAQYILFHTEVQATRRPDFPYRMWEYYSLLRLRRKRPVFPAVIYLAPGTGGVTKEQYTEALFGRTMLRFEYDAIGLPDLNASDWRDKGGPLSAALSALMKARKENRVRRRFEATKAIVRSPLNEAEKFLLVNVVQTFLPFDAQEEREFETMIATEKAQDVEEPMETWADMMILRGKSVGREIGRQEGLEEGAFIGERNALLKQMRKRFGALPSDIEARVEAIQDETQLDTLLDEVLTAATLDEMSLPN